MVIILAGNGLGYVPCNSVGETASAQLASCYQIDVAGRLVEAEVTLRPFYDQEVNG